MIEYDHGEIQFVCEGKDCTETLETGETEWADAKRCLDNAGWKARKVGNTWFHFCESCTPPRERR